MINKDQLINTGLIFYEEMFSSNINTNYRKAKNLIEKNKLVNTSEVFYRDMLKPKS